MYSFVCDYSGSIQSWILAQPRRSAVTDLCEEMAGIKLSEVSNDVEAESNESLVQNIIKTIQDMTNPFDQHEELLSLSSGYVVSNVTQKELLQAYNLGVSASEKFITEQLTSNSVKFDLPLPLLKLKTFLQKIANKKGKEVSKVKLLKRDIALFSRLCVVSQARHIEFEKVFCYSLSELPLSLTCSDGSMAKTVKSQLLHTLEIDIPDSQVRVKHLAAPALIFDTMAIAQALPKSSLPGTFKALAEFTLNKLKQKARQYKATRVDFVWDRYLSVSIKNVERGNRAQSRRSQRIKVSYPEQKLPTQWTKYLGIS